MITQTITTAVSTAIPASLPSPPQEFSSFSLGPLTIHMYAICILLGIIAALILTQRRWEARGGNPELVWDVAIWAVPLGIIGGRLYHVFSSLTSILGRIMTAPGTPSRSCISPTVASGFGVR
ncbi:prolipoprotein diacylglyceryl transferase family protein [Pseudoglutamicibacter albus]|uniref:prolipoprotein diacylglyceryl transferase family protein n=1 Tax=Pseudoglutamicibacter albus TaxID=98671 RepID=UPI003614DE3C